jgi:hypothetical protein
MFEEILQNADDDCVDADAFLLSPVLESASCFCANMKHLGIRQRKAGLPGLHDLHFVFIDMRQSEKNNPGKIALHAGLLGHCLSQGKSQAKSQAGLVIGFSLLPCFGRVGFLLGYHLRDFPILAVVFLRLHGNVQAIEQSALYISQVYQQQSWMAAVAACLPPVKCSVSSRRSKAWHKDEDLLKWLNSL